VQAKIFFHQWVSQTTYALYFDYVKQTFRLSHKPVKVYFITNWLCLVFWWLANSLSNYLTQTQCLTRQAT